MPRGQVLLVRRLRRRCGYAGVIVGEASNPGPSYVVYFLRAKVQKGVKGAKYNSEREYIGFTMKPPEDRAKEHMDDWKKKVTGALWLHQATIVGDPIVTEGPLAGSVCSSTVAAQELMSAP